MNRRPAAPAVWTLSRGHTQLRCEIRASVEGGVWVQLWSDERLVRARWFASPTLARAEVNALHVELTREGWSPVE